jgi:hypothetical protein
MSNYQIEIVRTWEKLKKYMQIVSMVFEINLQVLSF